MRAMKGYEVGESQVSDLIRFSVRAWLDDVTDFRPRSVQRPSRARAIGSTAVIGAAARVCGAPAAAASGLTGRDAAFYLVSNPEAHRRVECMWH
eukprot:472790-Hanusia_phi.AAC.5